MAKEEAIRLDGTVVEVLPSAMFRVEIEGQKTPVLAVISGRMRQHNIKVITGDVVEMEFSPYDMTRGRITRRR